LAAELPKWPPPQVFPVPRILLLSPKLFLFCCPAPAKTDNEFYPHAIKKMPNLVYLANPNIRIRVRERKRREKNKFY